MSHHLTFKKNKFFVEMSADGKTFLRIRLKDGSVDFVDYEIFYCVVLSSVFKTESSRKFLSSLILIAARADETSLRKSLLKEAGADETLEHLFPEKEVVKAVSSLGGNGLTEADFVSFFEKTLRPLERKYEIVDLDEARQEESENKSVASFSLEKTLLEAAQDPKRGDAASKLLRIFYKADEDFFDKAILEEEDDARGGERQEESEVVRSIMQRIGGLYVDIEITA